MSRKDEIQRQQEAKKKRLTQQLRQNLGRRKVQTRARREGDADERTDGISAAQSEKK